MRQRIVAGNWKMNTCLKKGLELAKEIDDFANKTDLKNTKIILGVPFTHIKVISDLVSFNKISVAAQNCSNHESGAYTGEVSAEMAKSAGAAFIIIGHSERRQIFNETGKEIAGKINLCLKNHMFPIVCCGETLEQREKNEHFNVVKSQVSNALFHLDQFNMERVIIAYEPVWAIGTGVTATSQQAQEMHSFIREQLKSNFNTALANKIPILYGGSMKPENAKDLLNQADIDGGLIGGASLKSDSFNEIIKIANNY